MIYISTPPEKIYVAKVNGVGVMRTEFDKAVNNNKRIYVQYMKMDFTDPKNQSQLDDIKKNSLENLINRELYLQYAAKNNIVPDAHFKRACSDLYASFISGIVFGFGIFSQAYYKEKVWINGWQKEIW